MEQKILSISGMHCPACDILIREIIKETEGIALIELTEQGTLTITIANESSLGILKKSIAASGYSVSDFGIDTCTKKINYKEIALLVVLGIVVWWGLYNLDIATYAASLGNNGTFGYGEMIFLGFIASLSTCLALVGGFVLMWGSVQGGKDISLRNILFQQLLFQGGRLGGFALGGFILGFIGSTLLFSPLINGVINMMISILLLFIGWNMLLIFPIRIPSWGGGDRLMKVLNWFSKKKWGGVFVGALTFFLPCGFSQMAQINALSTGNPFQGGVLLFLFALGTLPVLCILGITGNRFYMNPSSFTAKMMGVVLMVIALFLVKNAFQLLGLL